MSSGQLPELRGHNGGVPYTETPKHVAGSPACRAYRRDACVVHKSVQYGAEGTPVTLNRYFFKDRWERGKGKGVKS